MLSFVIFVGGILVLVTFGMAIAELGESIHRKKIIKKVKEKRALEEVTNAPFFKALEDPELVELGGPQKALPPDDIKDPFRGAT